MWEKNLKENECIYVYNWIICYTAETITLEINYTSIKLLKKEKKGGGETIDLKQMNRCVIYKSRQQAGGSPWVGVGEFLLQT